MSPSIEERSALAQQLAGELGGDLPLWSALVVITYHEHEADDPGIADIEVMLRTWWSEDGSPSIEGPDRGLSPFAEYSGLESRAAGELRRSLLFAFRDGWKLSRIAAALVRREVAGARPPSQAHIDAAFESDFDNAYDKLRDPDGVELVTLHALRTAVGGEREAFDAGLQRLIPHRYVLHTHDGRHGRMSKDEIAAGIREGGRPTGRLFVYAARRDSE